MKHCFRIFTAVLSIVAFTLLTSNPAFAQEPTNAITMSPGSTRISVDAGKSVSESFEVINGGSDGYKVELSVSPYHVTGENYDPEFTQLPGTVNSSEWITLDTTEAELAGLKVLSVSYTVEVPENTAPGGYYAVIFAQATRSDTGSGGVIPNNRVGNIIYITVNGDVATTGDVTGTPIPGFSFSSKVPLGLKLSNTGGIHFESTISFRVTDIAGKEVFKANLERMILPSTVRNLTVDWESSLPLGLYTVHREATVGSETIQLDDHKILIVNPWFLICAATFLSSIIVILFLRVRSRKLQKKK